MRDRVVRASPAPLWRRVGAWLVDGLALGALISAYVAIAVALARQAPPATQSTGLDWLVNRGEAYRAMLLHAAAFGAAVSVLYGAILHGRLGGTLGERAFGIRLVGRSGAAPSLLVCVLRALLALVSFAPLGLGFLVAFFLRRRRALHDVLSATWLVRLLDD